MKIVITSYPFVYQRYFEMLKYFPDDFEFILILPKIWRAKQGKVVYQSPASLLPKIKVITTPTYFYHSNYFLIGGLLKGWQPGLFSRLAKLNKQEKVDLVFSACEPNLLSILYNSYVTHHFKIKHVVFSWENIPLAKKFNNWKLKFFEAIIKKNLKLSQGLICGNQKAREIYNNYNSQILKTVCPLAGVDTNLFQPAIIANKQPDKITFIFAGAFGKRKGIFLIIEAFKDLQQKYQNLSLIFCGAGEIEKELRNKIKENNLIDSVKIYNWLPSTELVKFYQQADIFLYPSIPEQGWEEQFGFSMAEASACGLPIIATKIGSINEVVVDRQTGLLIEPNNLAALKSAMAELIEDANLRKNLGAQGRQYILANYSYQKVAEKFANFFRQIKNLN